MGLLHFMEVMSVLRKIKRLVPERSPLRLGWHYAKAFIAALRYGFPARKHTVIGITGTDGKTTTVMMTAHILRSAGKKSGVISTTAFHIDDRVELNVTQKTSMSPSIVQKKLRQMVNAGCTFAVIEVSSHGLVQGRVHHIYPAVAAITNTSPEHLDYHKTMEQYRRDKGKLFSMLKRKGAKVLNAADETYALYSLIPSSKTIIYGKEGSDLWVTDVASLSSGCHARLHTDLGGVSDLTLSIPGTFNLENAQCAIGCAMAIGIPLETSLDALKSFRGVEGRLQRIDEGQSFNVYVDFTVTPEAYRRTLETLRGMTPPGKRVLVLASSCGNRMPEKRPLIGRITSDLADIVVVTSDETYGEPHGKIMDEIWEGIDQDSAIAFRVPDRREAIEFILAQAQEGDSVALCGMGGVTTMMTAKGQIPWDEAKIARDVLRLVFPPLPSSPK